VQSFAGVVCQAARRTLLRALMLLKMSKLYIFNNLLLILVKHFCQINIPSSLIFPVVARVNKVKIAKSKDLGDKSSLS
jgi:hypothetical protein